MPPKHKQTERDIIRSLTEVCEDAKVEHEGFVWLTHEVNYQRFPQSLVVILVFDEYVSEPSMLSALAALVPEVQRALKPIVGGELPARQIEARYEHTMH